MFVRIELGTVALRPHLEKLTLKELRRIAKKVGVPDCEQARRTIIVDRLLAQSPSIKCEIKDHLEIGLRSRLQKIWDKHHSHIYQIIAIAVALWAIYLTYHPPRSSDPLPDNQNVTCEGSQLVAE